VNYSVANVCGLFIVGEDKPLSLLLSPVILDDNVIAVLELASFENFPSYQLDFIRSLCETIAITLSRVQIKQ